MYATFKLTYDALKEQTITSVDDQYINVLEANIIGYSNVTPIVLLNLMWKNYNNIQESDLSANKDIMKTPWHPPTSIKDMYKQLRNGQRFAKKGNKQQPTRHGATKIKTRKHKPTSRHSLLKKQ